MDTRVKQEIRELSGSCLLLLLALTAGCSSPRQQFPEARLDLGSFLRSSREDPYLGPRLVFLDNHDLLAMTNGQSASGLVVDVESQKVTRKIPFGECFVSRVWRTADSRIVVFCRDRLMVYDANLQKQAEMKLDDWAPHIEVSPDGKLFTLDSGRYVRDSSGKSVFRPSYSLFDADTLEPLNGNLPPGFTPITNEGSVVTKDDGIYLLPFAGGTGTLLAKRRPGSPVAFPQVLAENRIVLEANPIRSSVVVDSNGKVAYSMSDWPGYLAIKEPNPSSSRFLMAFTGRTTWYSLRHLPGDLLGADEKPNMAVFRVLDASSGKVLLHLSWGIGTDSVFGQALDAVGALSADGNLFAVIHNRSLEIYRVPAE